MVVQTPFIHQKLITSFFIFFQHEKLKTFNYDPTWLPWHSSLFWELEQIFCKTHCFFKPDSKPRWPGWPYLQATTRIAIVKWTFCLLEWLHMATSWSGSLPLLVVVAFNWSAALQAGLPLAMPIHLPFLGRHLPSCQHYCLLEDHFPF